MKLGYLCIIGASILVRFGLFLISADEWLSHRVEIAGPTSSFHRVVEGVFLWKNGLSPYSSNMYHQSPLSLLILHPLASSSQFFRSIAFIGLDMLIVYLLYSLAREVFGKNAKDRDFLSVTDEGEKKKRCAAHYEALCLEDEPKSSLSPELVAILYALNPFAIVCSVGMSTVLLQHIFILLSILATLKGSVALGAISLSLAAFDSFYAIFLLPPLIALAHKKKKGLLALGCFVCSLVGLFYISSKFIDLDKMIYNVFAFPIMIHDLVPNLGIFWYLFTEVFSHFRGLFLTVYHGHVISYVVPLLIRLRHRPVFLFCLWCGILSIFKAYPCVSDSALFLSLLPLFYYDLTGSRGLFFVGNILLYVTVLSPVFWGMWIESGTANSNFYFGLCLAWNLAYAFLAVESFLTILRKDKAARRYHRTSQENDNIIK